MVREFHDVLVELGIRVRLVFQALYHFQYVIGFADREVAFDEEI